MKKIFALILSLCLLCSAAAFADTTITNTSGSQTASTTVTYTIEAPVYEYIVTIPSALTLTRDGDALPQGTMTVSINAENYNVQGNVLYVCLGNDSFQMTHENGEDFMPYKISYTGGYECKTDDIIVSVRGTTRDEIYEEADLTVQVTSLENATAIGEYSDIITFYVTEETTNDEFLPV